MALILGAFMLHGVTPGPTLLAQHPEMFWGIVTSMFVGNCILILTMLPLISFLSKITLIPTNVIIPIVVVACLAGAYGVNNNPIDIVTMTVFGLLGYLMMKFGFPPAPLVLAFVLGPIMETALRQSLIMSRADFLIFWSRPVSGALMTIFVIVLLLPIVTLLLKAYRQRTLKQANSETTPASVVLPAAVGLIAVLGSIIVGSQAHAQGYPAKSVTMIVPFPPGGRTDLTARAVAQALKTELGQAVVVVNKPGASGVLGAKDVASAAPDGYTIGLFSTGFLTTQYTVPTPTNPAEYEFVALVNRDPAAVAVKAGTWETLPDFLKFARANPGKLKVGINAGSSAHIFAAAFVNEAGLDVVYVPFRGGGERTVALAGGHIDVDFDIVAPMKPMMESNKIRVLGVASPQRVSSYPEIPTMAEGGVNLAISSWHGVFVPRGTPREIVQRLGKALHQVCTSPEFLAQMKNLLLGVSYMDDKQFREFFAAEDKLNFDLIQKLGLLDTSSKPAK
jgi:tripartite-type tricarboxylate transporter receptor subunit TctC